MIDLAGITWRTSSYSGSSQNCVEVGFVPPGWRTSSYSAASQNCVEVAQGGAWTAVRDSKDRGGGTLLVSAPSWCRFIAVLRAGRGAL